jgi:hypothetical protein
MIFGLMTFLDWLSATAAKTFNDFCQFLSPLLPGSRLKRRFYHLETSSFECRPPSLAHIQIASHIRLVVLFTEKSGNLNVQNSIAVALAIGLMLFLWALWGPHSLDSGWYDGEATPLVVASVDGPKLHRKEIGTRQHLPVDLQELLPRHPLSSLGRRFQARPFLDIRDGSPAHFMPRVSQRPVNPSVTPRAIFPGQFQNQLLNSPFGSWPSSFADANGIVFLYHKAPMPSQQSIGRHQAAEPLKCFAPKRFALGGQTSALFIIKARLLPHQFFEHPDFFLQVFNDVLLIAIHPASDADHQKAKGFIVQCRP